MEMFLAIYSVIHIGLLIAFYVILFKVIKEKKNENESHFAYLARDGGTLFYFLFSIVVALCPIIPLVLFLDAVKKFRKEKKRKRKKRKDSIYFFESRYRDWNNLYKCSNCSMYSRHYQLTEDSELGMRDQCPFCKKTYTLDKVNDSDVSSIEDIPFCEKIKDEDKESHMFLIYEKWDELERKQKEFQQMKTTTEVQVEQLKAYEKLKETDLSDKLSEYEKKLQENLKEMEDFKESLLKEFNMQ